MKECRVCGKEKEDFDFYKHPNMKGGRDSKCKECVKFSVKENRDKKAEYYKEYDAWRFKNQPQVRERHKTYQATPEGKSAMRKARVMWMNANPEKRAAHVILGNAVRDKRVEKPRHCSNCGDFYPSRKIHAHHHDYTKPLDVTWLCVYCHVEEHKDEIDEMP